MLNYIFTKIDSGVCLDQLGAEESFLVASLIKTVYAISAIENLDLNKEVFIPEEDCYEAGTNEVKYLANGNGVRLSLRALVNLMIAESCNVATKVIRKEIGDLKIEETIAKLKLQGTYLSGPDNLPISSLNDILKVYLYVYNDNNLLDIFSFASSVNRYFVFDQLKVEIITSKTSTIKNGDMYTIGNAGIFRLNGEVFFIGAFAMDKDISNCIVELRNLGKKLVSL